MNKIISCFFLIIKFSYSENFSLLLDQKYTFVEIIQSVSIFLEHNLIEKIFSESHIYFFYQMKISTWPPALFKMALQTVSEFPVDQFCPFSRKYPWQNLYWCKIEDGERFFDFRRLTDIRLGELGDKKVHWKTWVSFFTTVNKKKENKKK